MLSEPVQEALLMPDADLDRQRRFEALLATHSRDVISYCRWRLADMNDVEDVVADVFLAAWRRLDVVPDGDACRIWLYATARRVLANHRRSIRRRDALSERLATTAGVTPDAVSSDDESDIRVHAALGRLRTLDREVLLLSEWEGLTPQEIGAVLGCRPVTARGRLHRARRRFRNAYELLALDQSDHLHPKECQDHV